MIAGGVPVRHLARVEPLREPGDLCYSRGMPNNEPSDYAPALYTAAQAMEMIASSMENAYNAIDNAGSLDEAKATLQGRAQGAREMADNMK